MANKLSTRVAHAWNALTNKDPTPYYLREQGTYRRPDRVHFNFGVERTIITSIYNRIAVDAAAITLAHVRVDENDRYIETIYSGLHDCLNVSANADQTGRAFIQDAMMSMFDEGEVAIVPVDTTINPSISQSYDINSLRTAKVLEWFPNSVRVRVYNERTGLKEDKTLPKSMVAIVENPFHAVMNEPNSIAKRLINKLSILDAVDENTGSGKLDLIIGLPYVIKSEARRIEAEKRRTDIIDQLTKSKYGIAYTDGTEKITQLNRPVENNLLGQIEFLTSMLYSQLGITQSILDGTADEKTMLNYYNRTVIPAIMALVEEMKRKFLTKTARTQKQTIKHFLDPFLFVPATDIAEIADKMTRNEVLSSNDIRAIIGYKPSKDPAADELRNKNLNKQVESESTETKPTKGASTNEKET